ncbi:MAG TPA: OmpA family protein [Thermoanaerobaculia bacterium]|nr:OmpA family protein [Thermoanaerobaculia bacterium]
MKSPALFAGALALALTVPSAFAAEINLVGVTYPEGRRISVPFTRTAIAPKAATLTGTMRMEKGQVDIRIAWANMEPAVLFAGNITSYSVWAVTRDGRPENMGELQVREKKSGEGSFRTGRVNFAVIVTAEVLPGGVLPSDLVLFVSGKVDEKTTAKNWEFPIETSSMISEFTRPGNPSIANLTYTAVKGAEPIELQQARKAYDLAVEIKAETVAPKEMETAKAQLEQAQNSVKGGSTTVTIDYSRRALDSAGTAARMKVQDLLQQRVDAEIAAKRAAEEKKRQELEAAKARANSAETEKAKMAAEVDRLKAEQEQLMAGLKASLGQYMGVEETPRGLVLNMGDILFDVNKTTLKKDAELALAKLSAILSVFEKLQVRAEGFTDTTGKEELNMKLSAERARTVNDFLVAQGVAAGRLTHAGYGPANPVGDNATAEGRAKNRRVELILKQGPVTATPGGMVAPELPAKPAAKPAAAPAKK